MHLSSLLSSSSLLTAAAISFGVACGTTLNFEGASETSPLPAEAPKTPGDRESDSGICVSETLAAAPVPLAMLIVMDQSTSMNSTQSPTKWDMARRAMIVFADTPGAIGAKLGLTLFPPELPSLDECVASSYSPIVSIARLPENGIPLRDALLSRSKAKGTNTPMSPGLAGGVELMKAHLGKNPNEEGVIILVTDGAPAGCSDSVSKVVKVAGDAQTGTPRVRTFVVGMEGADFDNLDAIAAAGGGALKAFDASGGTSDAGLTPQQQLLDALESIRSRALVCEYLVPTTQTSAGAVDPSSVEVAFTAGTNEPVQKFEPVESEAACSTTTDGYYFDDPKSPKRIILCPASCESVRAGADTAKLEVRGCVRP